MGCVCAALGELALGEFAIGGGADWNVDEFAKNGCVCEVGAVAKHAFGESYVVEIPGVERLVENVTVGMSVEHAVNVDGVGHVPGMEGLIENLVVFEHVGEEDAVGNVPSVDGFIHEMSDVGEAVAEIVDRGDIPSVHGAFEAIVIFVSLCKVAVYHVAQVFVVSQNDAFLASDDGFVGANGHFVSIAAEGLEIVDVVVLESDLFTAKVEDGYCALVGQWDG